MFEVKLFRISAGCMMTACVAVFLITTWHWPLVSDASLMHAIVNMMAHGMRPYVEVHDLNLPGSYAASWLVMHTLGKADEGWRLFDLLLDLLAGLTMGAMAPYSQRSRWLAALLGGGLFALLHGQDGVMQTGQRDLIAAVLLAGGCAALLQAMRSGASMWAALAGTAAGMATCIKPTAVLFVVAWLLVSGLWGPGERRARRTAAMLAGSALAPAWMCLWLIQNGAWSAFAYAMTRLAPYHAALARRPLSFLLVHSVAPAEILLVLWGCLILGRRLKSGERASDGFYRERYVLLLNCFVGLISYCVQGKALPYHRYPLLLFLVALVFHDAVGELYASTRKAAPALAVAIVAFACFVMAPHAAYSAARYDWGNQDFAHGIERDLQLVDHQQLNGLGLNRQVQCIDSVNGCITALDHLGLTPATGMIYDEFLFGQEHDGVVRSSRNQFVTELKQHPAKIIVVADGLFPVAAGGYWKLDRWPELANMLARDYRLVHEQPPVRAVRWWSRTVPGAGYRIYLAR